MSTMAGGEVATSYGTGIDNDPLLDNEKEHRSLKDQVADLTRLVAIQTKQIGLLLSADSGTRNGNGSCRGGGGACPKHCAAPSTSKSRPNGGGGATARVKISSHPASRLTGPSYMKWSVEAEQNWMADYILYREQVDVQEQRQKEATKSSGKESSRLKASVAVDVRMARKLLWAHLSKLALGGPAVTIDFGNMCRGFRNPTMMESFRRLEQPSQAAGVSDNDVLRRRIEDTLDMILNLHKGERVVAAENSRRQALDATAKAKKKKEEEAQKIQAAGAARAAATLAAAKKKGTGVAGGSKATPHGNGTRPRTGAASSSSSSSSSSASSSSARSTAKGGKAKGRRRRWPSSASAGAGADADAFPDENQTLDQRQKQLAAKQSASPTFTSTPALSNPPLSPISRKQVKPKARRSGSGSTPTAADRAAGENEFDEYPWFFLARENDTLEKVASECAIDREFKQFPDMTLSYPQKNMKHIHTAGVARAIAGTRMWDDFVALNKRRFKLLHGENVLLTTKFKRDTQLFIPQYACAHACGALPDNDLSCKKTQCCHRVPQWLWEFEPELAKEAHENSAEKNLIYDASHQNDFRAMNIVVCDNEVVCENGGVKTKKRCGSHTHVICSSLDYTMINGCVEVNDPQDTWKCVRCATGLALKVERAAIEEHPKQPKRPKEPLASSTLPEPTSSQRMLAHSVATASSTPKAIAMVTAPLKPAAGGVDKGLALCTPPGEAAAAAAATAAPAPSMLAANKAEHQQAAPPVALLLPPPPTQAQYSQEGPRRPDRLGMQQKTPPRPTRETLSPGAAPIAADGKTCSGGGANSSLLKRKADASGGGDGGSGIARAYGTYVDAAVGDAAASTAATTPPTPAAAIADQDASKRVKLGSVQPFAPNAAVVLPTAQPVAQDMEANAVQARPVIEVD